MSQPSPAMRNPAVAQLVWRCPAKLNLRLAVVGRRLDGYHELRSVVAPISLHDRLEAAWDAGAREPSLEILGETDLAVTPDNLVLRAARAFAAAAPFPGSVHFRLHKEIPVGAGLGGGSSNAAATLLALQMMWGFPLEPGDLEAIAVRLGADVPFFLRPELSIMRGIGEALTPAPHLSAQLLDRQFLVFKPSLGISTAWAYEALAQAGAYQRVEDEEALLAAFEAGTRRPRDLPFNAFRAVVDERYPTLPILLESLREIPGVVAEMSGSGSACFAFFRDPALAERLLPLIHEAWGEAAFARSVTIV
jgi:4-diphosphocytidyl-2-C-methyl-D-erythritol kinase